MKNFTRDMFLRDHLDIKSPDLFNWDMFPVSSILKKELRADEAEREIINGYANAVNSLLKEIHNQNHPTPNELIITSNSLIIPFVFLCRHTIELIIKYLRRQLNLPSQNKHKLINLWNDVEKAILKESASYPFTKTFSKNARIQGTTDDDPTVQKTIKHYIPHIVYNKSNVHFILHNTYSTLKYIVKKGDDVLESDYPMAILYPISNILCFATLYTEKEIDVSKDSFIIPIEKCENDDNRRNR